MAGFKFGMISSLDGQLTLGATLMIIVYLIIIEVITGIVEYFLADSPIYTKMLQRIYKLIMFMGIDSFIIVMIVANIHNGTAEMKWIQSIEFIHIFLFFVSIFFVIHVFYLMRTAIKESARYLRIHREKDKSVIDDLKSLKSSNGLESLIFKWNYLPFSSLRDRAEFKIIHALFRDNYCLPDDFDFALYLKGCFEFHALKTIDIGIFSWLVVMILCVINYLRMHLHGGFNCSHNEAQYAKDAGFRRELGSLSSLPAAGSSQNMTFECHMKQLKLYFLCAVLLGIYTIVVLYFSRLYELRYYSL